MARAVKTTAVRQPAEKNRRPAPAVPKSDVQAERKAAAPKTNVAPKLSKEELRVLAERLERTNATLRARSREAVRAAKAASARIAELEAQVEQLEGKVAAQEASREASPTAAARPARQSPAKPNRPRKQKQQQEQGIDPGDAVPPGVAVQEPAPEDEEARQARENLERHLGED